MSGHPAIRIRKRGSGKYHAWHWLLDPGRTFCGLAVDDLNVVESSVGPVARLDTVEGCRGCVRAVEGWTANAPGHIEGQPDRVIAPSVPGRLRKTGSLSHGTRIRRGGRLR